MKIGDLVKMAVGLGPNTPGGGHKGYGVIVDSDHDGQWIHVSWGGLGGDVKRHFYKDIKVAK